MKNKMNKNEQANNTIGGLCTKRRNRTIPCSSKALSKTVRPTSIEPSLSVINVPILVIVEADVYSVAVVILIMMMVVEDSVSLSTNTWHTHIYS